MWKIFKELFGKFFSSELQPVEPSLTPLVTVDVMEEEEEPIEEEEKEKSDPPTPVWTLHQQLTKNFRLSEFKCNDEAGTPVPPEYLASVKELATNLQVLRDEIGKVININSGYRTPEYNKKVGGAKTSQHTLAKAADIRVKGIGPKKLGEKIKSLIKEGKMAKGGVGIYKTFVHYDIRGVNRRWYGSGVKK
jgi:uncharacterized protein YcbK (DUF882 family)